jgi:hypothetical protein
MLRRLLCVFAFALTLAPVATADGGGPAAGVNQGWDGVTASGIGVRYVTVATGTDTTLEMIRKRDGRVLNFMSLTGQWGIPAVANDGSTGGLSTDGRTLVLADASPPIAGLRNQSSFLVVDTKNWRASQPVFLQGDFAFDALSPNGSRLYLIQHVSASDSTRYIVRAYDLSTGRLLPGRIADRTQKGWVMQGYPVSRATTADGRWAYTLYRNNGGYPFIHALNTVRGTAHCIGLPWHGSQQYIFNVRLSLRDHARQLAVHWLNGTPIFAMDTKTYRLTRATVARAGFDFPWWTLGIAGAVVLLGALVLRRGALRRREAPEVLPT